MARETCILCQIPGHAQELNGMGMYRCGQCGLVWQANPQLEGAYYETNPVDVNEKKLTARRSNGRQRLHLFERYADLNNLLDVGCGDGTFLKILQDSGHKNIIGLDPNVSVVEFAKKNGVKAVVGGVNSAGKIIAENHIHTITMFHVLEHLRDPLEDLRQLYEALPPGGKIILETPNLESYAIRKAEYRHELIYPEHLFYFNERNLKELARKSGFKVVKSGKRDFDQNNMSIKESLMRLGLGRGFFVGARNDGEIKYSSQKIERKLLPNQAGIFRSIIRTCLNELVIMSGRLNYIWIVGEKTQ